jgi:uncharacterized membrane protein
MAETSNPYAAPRAQVVDETLVPGNFIPGGRGVPAGHGLNWLTEGWELFKAAPAIWIAIVVVFFIILMFCAFIPFVGPLAQNLLMPVLMAGIAIGCRAIDEGRSLEFKHLFDGFNHKRISWLVAVGGLYLAGFIVIMIVTMVVTGAGMFAIFAAGGSRPDPETARAALATVAIAMLVMFGLMVPLLMTVWFAPSLVVFHDLGPFEAMKQSFTGCVRNIVPFLVYGVIGMGLSIVATIPLALGWLALGPVMAASVYTAYRDIYLD